jgi:hypothetical protein
MKKFFVVLGGIFLAILVFVAVGTAIVSIRGTALDKESRNYVESAIPAVFSQWSEKAMFERASPEFKKATTIDGLDRLFRWASNLGELERWDKPQGQSLVKITPEYGQITAAEYSTKAHFKKGEGLIRLALIKHGTQWQILRFEIQSPQLIPP